MVYITAIEHNQDNFLEPKIRLRICRIVLTNYSRNKNNKSLLKVYQKRGGYKL